MDDPEALAAMKSPVRQRLLDRLEAIGPASAGELAAELDRPPDRVYYHLRRLERVGMIEAVSERVRGRHRETLYDLAHRRWHIAYDPASKRSRRAVEALTAAMLREAQRDFEAGWSTPGLAVRGKQRTQWSLRLEARLDRDQLAELNEHLDAIARLLRGARGAEATRRKTTHVALTWVLAGVPARKEGSR